MIGTELKISTTMKLITKKNISVVIAVMMASLIISSAQANSSKHPEKRSTLFIHSEELVEYVEDYFNEMEMNSSFEEEQTVKLFDVDNNILFNGLQEDMDENTTQLFNSAEFLSEMAGTEYYKILH